MMLPQGYRYDFDLIFAQVHDRPPIQPNIIEIPANFAYVEPQGIYHASKPAVGIVIGGDNSIYTMSETELRTQLNRIVSYYSGHEIAVTTSPRTPERVENMVKAYGFDYTLIYSEEPNNPIPDFLSECETVFLTADSTSMISEAISFGKANVMVLPLGSEGENKFSRLLDTLEKEGYLSRFDGTFREANRKIDFSQYARKVLP
jgi:mitochondrial fission protein ELM1